MGECSLFAVSTTTDGEAFIPIYYRWYYKLPDKKFKGNFYLVFSFG